MKLDILFSLNYSKNIKLKLQKRNNNHLQNNATNNFDKGSYTKFYYPNQISFCKSSCASDIIKRIGEDNFPSPKILEKIKGFDKSNNFSLYDIHIAHYGNLLNCTTLDEAKEIYPEFRNVIDAKYIEMTSLNKKSAIYKIANNEIKGANIDNLSLELLKKQYGQLISTAKKEEYYNITNNTIYALFELLNIKKLNHKYINTVIQSQDKLCQKKSLYTKKQWANDNGTLRKKIKQTKQLPEYRKIRSDIAKKQWANDDGHLREMLAQTIQSEENRNRISLRMKKLWASEDNVFREKIKQSKQT